MSKQSIKYSLITFMLLFSTSVFSAPSATEKLTQFVQTVMTFQAQFEQTVYDAKGAVIEQAKGIFILDRPGRFRWDYDEPYSQYIVADGERIWFYDVDLEQITVKSQADTLTDTPATLLSGAVAPEEKYTIQEVPSNDGLSWVELIPKDEEANFQVITLVFDDKGLHQMLMRDSFDQQTRLVFTHVIENKKLADDVFIFTPPTGIDVVGDTGQ